MHAVLGQVASLIAVIVTVTEEGGGESAPDPYNVCHHIPLTSYCQFRGIAAVAVALAVFVGLPIIILGTNVGYRKATAIMLAALFGWLTLNGFLWMMYPRGPLVTREVAGLPLSISTRLPAILTMAGAGILTVVLCIALNRLDRPVEEEGMLAE